jgi:two-component system, cell cycle sensor histidine kinase and response regulator CckA
VRDAEGSPAEMIGISTEVTDRKDLERRMQHAQKLETLGKFAGGIAHDFNNVVAAILGFSELLLEDFEAGDPRFAEVREIQKAGESAKQLTSQLMSFSRQQPIQPTAVDLNQSITQNSGLLRQLLGKRVRLETALDAVPSVWADPGQIQQVLVNLATNARDAMPDGGRLRIETAPATISECVADREQVRAGTYAMLTVGDCGVGMPLDVQARIFEPFFTTKPSGHGTGFGLSTVYGIVRQSNGFMEVTSAVGEGTTFRIHLPAVPSARESVER